MSLPTVICPIQFENLARKTRKRVFSLAFRLSGNRSDAEDLTQEAYLRAFKHFERFQGERPFENWVLRIVSRLFLDLLRHRGRRVRTSPLDTTVLGAQQPVALDVADDRPSPEALCLVEQFDEPLAEALQLLSPEQRLLIVLADIEGVAYKELAELFGAPVGTIRSRLHRTHRHLRKLLEGNGGRQLSPSLSPG